MVKALNADAVPPSITPWSEIEPSILAAMFECGFDPEHRGLSQYARSGIV